MAQTPEHAARVLGLIGRYSIDDVKRARREMALKYHPDLCSDAELATRHMARVNAAVDTLMAHLASKTQAAPKRSGQTRRRARASESRTERNRAQSTASKADATGPTRAKPTKEPARGANTVQSNSASDAERRAWKAERALAERASASYRTILDRIGKQQRRHGIDLQILKFEPTGP